MNGEQIKFVVTKTNCVDEMNQVKWIANAFKSFINYNWKKMILL